MEQTTHDVAGWVDRIDDIAVGMTDTALRTDGSVPPPTVHLVLDGLDPPYVGHLTCRPMYRGDDAAAAVRAMGLMGSMLGAARLVVAYENDDLCTALELPDADQAPPGVVVIDADRDGHEARWQPVRFHRGPPNAAGGATVLPEWGPGLRYPRGLPLPQPVADLLETWRAPRVWSEVEFLRAFAAMEVGGYAMRWVTRPEGERDQPAWMRLLAPIM
ncbi:MAG: hypothetical protein L0H64_14255 [Pseudonocardia sp.]|nr:hypothetical protein [Pseudonocardia sp.]